MENLKPYDKSRALLGDKLIDDDGLEYIVVHQAKGTEEKELLVVSDNKGFIAMNWVENDGRDPVGRKRFYMAPKIKNLFIGVRNTRITSHFKGDYQTSFAFESKDILIDHLKEFLGGFYNSSEWKIMEIEVEV